jgi:outer membrane protein TolC
VPEATPGLLLARRPDVRSAEVALASAARTVQIDRLALFPRFSIQPGAVLSATGGGGTGLWSLVAGLAVPVLDRARLLASLRVSEARGQQAVVGYEQAVQTAFGEAENALTRVDAGHRRIDQLVLATDRARYAFDTARRGYAAGLTDLTTLLQAERIWLQNRATLDAARFGLLSDTVSAIRALGGGWNPQADLAPSAQLPSIPEPANGPR